jgi:hypothetical protein
MGVALCKRAATVKFWDGFAPWYKLWIEHNHYHDRIIDVLTTMVEPSWKVLDIGTGSGVLSLPLCAIGCDVTALEPSIGMRGLLFEKAFNRGIDWIKVDDSRWEDAPSFYFWRCDLIMACNSLHLTEHGFERSLGKAFRTDARNMFVVTELAPGIRTKWSYGDCSMLFAKTYETDCFFAYHHLTEVWDHHAYKKSCPLSPEEELEIRANLTVEDGHVVIKDKAYVSMYGWRKAATIENNTGFRGITL